MARIIKVNSVAIRNLFHDKKLKRNTRGMVTKKVMLRHSEELKVEYLSQ